ncbi:MAG: hypothetical protein E7097_08545 [Bacteroides sp.]|nr:hypothetical protein [Bacteroides sp.]
MIIKDREAFFANPKEALLEISNMLSCGGKFYPTDLYTSSIINRAMAINDAYFRLTKLNNYVAAAPYVRMQMDNCISCYAGLIIDEKHMLKFINHFIAGKDLYKFKDANKNSMYEKYVVQELNKRYPMFKKGYEYYNDMIHLSNQHFQSAHSMKNGRMQIAFEQGSYYTEEEISCHNNNICVVNKQLADMLIKLWLPYKEEKLEQLEKKQQEENIPMNQIIRELIKDYPEIVNLLSKPKNTD